MKIWHKIVRAGTINRISRFHTLRGNLVPLTEILLIPSEILFRIFHVHRKGPWLPRSAVKALNECIKKGSVKHVLEIGGGGSSKFFADRCLSLITIEEDPTYAESIQKQLLNTECDFRLIQCETEIWLNQLDKQDTEYDLILIDGATDEVRKKCLIKLAEIYKNAIIVLDNSDREIFRGVEYEVRATKIARYTGVLRNPFQASETTFFWFK